MGCNCVSQEQIKKLHEIYGEKIDTSNSEEIKFNLKKILTQVGVTICILFIFPLILTYVIYKAFIKKESKIKISDFLKKRENTDVAIAKTIINETKFVDNV